MLALPHSSTMVTMPSHPKPLETLKGQNVRRSSRNRRTESMKKVTSQSRTIQRIVEKEIEKATEEGRDPESLLRVLRCAATVQRENEKALVSEPDAAASRVIDASQIKEGRYLRRCRACNVHFCKTLVAGRPCHASMQCMDQVLHGVYDASATWWVGCRRAGASLPLAYCPQSDCEGCGQGTRWQIGGKYCCKRRSCVQKMFRERFSGPRTPHAGHSSPYTIKKFVQTSDTAWLPATHAGSVDGKPNESGMCCGCNTPSPFFVEGIGWVHNDKDCKHVALATVGAREWPASYEWWIGDAINGTWMEVQRQRGLCRHCFKHTDYIIEGVWCHLEPECTAQCFAALYE